MNTPLKKEKAVREVLSGFGITQSQRDNNRHFIAIGIYSSLALLITLTIITLIEPHFFWGHFLVINYPLHSTIETIGAVSAILMAFLLIDIFTEKITPSYVFISMGFLGMGIWDLFHATVPPGNGFVLTHSVALLIGGFFFFLSIFPVGETIIRHKVPALFLAAVFFVFTAVSTVIFRPYLPKMIGDGGEFTRTADIINIAAGSLFLITAVKLSVDYYRHRAIGITILVFVATLSALAGLTFHYSQAWTDNWWFWHVLRLCAYISLVIYLLVEFGRLMKERSAVILLSEQKNDELAASEQTLKALNQELISKQQRLVEEKERTLDIMQDAQQARREAESLNTELDKIITELKESNEQLERFAYVASHDLQEPLRKVNSFTQLFERRYSDLVDEKGQKYIYYIKDGTQRMQQLISDLLKYSRINTQGKEFREINTSEIVEDVKDLFNSKLKQTNGKIVIGELPKIYGDESQIRQVFQNLVGNAIKFKKQGVDPKIAISAEQAGSNWVFKVKDNGIGIDEKYKDRIFVIFQRLHSKEAFEGTGIGLAICMQIIKRHGGEISFTSEPGKGTEFFFTIPTIEKTMKREMSP